MLGYNMYAYCNNNPVNMSDPSGYDPFDYDEMEMRRARAYARRERQRINELRAEAARLKSDPSKLRWDGSAASTYAGESDMSVIARMIYGEDKNINAYYAHLWLLENRRRSNETPGGRRFTKAGGVNTYRGLVLGANQFTCMDNQWSLNPQSKFSIPRDGEQYRRDWESAVDAAYKLLANGIDSIPNHHPYHNSVDNRDGTRSGNWGYPAGDTWFFDKN